MNRRWVTWRLALMAGYTTAEVQAMPSLLCHAPNGVSWTVYYLPTPTEKGGKR